MSDYLRLIALGALNGACWAMIYYLYCEKKSESNCPAEKITPRIWKISSDSEEEKVKSILKKEPDTIIINDVISLELAKEFYEIIKSIPDSIKIKLVLSTSGGDGGACQNILRLLLNHGAGFNAYIKYMAVSGGTASRKYM